MASSQALSWTSGQYGIPATPIDSGIRFGFGVAAASDGTIYYAEFNGRSITKVSADGTISSIVGGLDCGPSHLYVDKESNIFFTEYQCGKVMEYSRSGILSTLATGYSSPSGVVSTDSGDVYFVTEGGDLYLIHNGSIVQVLSGLSTPEGLARGNNGDLFLGIYGNPNAGQTSGAIMKYSVDTLTTLVSKGLSRVRDVASDSNGDVYFVEESNYEDQGNSGTLGKLDVTNSVVTLLTNIDYPEGLAVASDGSVYFTAERGNTTDAGTILFRYPPNATAQVATPIGGTANSPNAIVITGAPPVSVAINGSTITYSVTTSQESSSRGFVLLSRELVKWDVDTTANLPMPGSWSPLPRFYVTIDGGEVAETTYLMRVHQGQRWPSTISNGIEIPASGFSEQPFGFVLAFPFVLEPGTHTISIKFPT
ncbi:MAG TPA: hypothetical protein VG844_01015 [Terracidiphilus sp.]|nr:hypothetical protein [Terracidiphilus sp.]